MAGNEVIDVGADEVVAGLQREIQNREQQVQLRERALQGMQREMELQEERLLKREEQLNARETTAAPRPVVASLPNAAFELKQSERQLTKLVAEKTNLECALQSAAQEMQRKDKLFARKIEQMIKLRETAVSSVARERDELLKSRNQHTPLYLTQGYTFCTPAQQHLSGHNASTSPLGLPEPALKDNTTSPLQGSHKDAAMSPLFKPELAVAQSQMQRASFQPELGVMQSQLEKRPSEGHDAVTSPMLHHALAVTQAQLSIQRSVQPELVAEQSHLQRHTVGSQDAISSPLFQPELMVSQSQLKNQGQHVPELAVTQLQLQNPQEVTEGKDAVTSPVFKQELAATQSQLQKCPPAGHDAVTSPLFRPELSVAQSQLQKQPPAGHDAVTSPLFHPELAVTQSQLQKHTPEWHDAVTSPLFRQELAISQSQLQKQPPVGHDAVTSPLFQPELAVASQHLEDATTSPLSQPQLTTRTSQLHTTLHSAPQSTQATSPLARTSAIPFSRVALFERSAQLVTAIGSPSKVLTLPHGLSEGSETLAQLAAPSPPPDTEQRHGTVAPVPMPGYQELQEEVFKLQQAVVDARQERDAMKRTLAEHLKSVPENRKAAEVETELELQQHETAALRVMLQHAEDLLDTIRLGASECDSMALENKVLKKEKAAQKVMAESAESEHELVLSMLEVKHKAEVNTALGTSSQSANTILSEQSDRHSIVVAEMTAVAAMLAYHNSCVLLGSEKQCITFEQECEHRDILLGNRDAEVSSQIEALKVQSAELQDTVDAKQRLQETVQQLSDLLDAKTNEASKENDEHGKLTQQHRDVVMETMALKDTVRQMEKATQAEKELRVTLAVHLDEMRAQEQALQFKYETLSLYTEALEVSSQYIEDGIDEILHAALSHRYATVEVRGCYEWYTTLSPAEKQALQSAVESDACTSLGTSSSQATVAGVSPTLKGSLSFVLGFKNSLSSHETPAELVRRFNDKKAADKVPLLLSEKKTTELNWYTKDLVQIQQHEEVVLSPSTASEEDPEELTGRSFEMAETEPTTEMAKTRAVLASTQLASAERLATDWKAAAELANKWEEAAKQAQERISSEAEVLRALQEEMNASKEKYHTACSERDSWESKYHALETQAGTDMKRVRAELEGELCTAAELLLKMKAMHSLACEEVATMAAELEKAQKGYVECQAAVHAADQSLADVNRDLEIQKAARADSVRQLAGDCERVASELHNAQGEVRRYTEQLENAKVQCVELSEALKSTQRALDERGREHSKIKAERDHFAAKLEKELSAGTSMKTLLDTSRDKLHKAKLEAENLRQALVATEEDAKLNAGISSSLEAEKAKLRKTASQSVKEMEIAKKEKSSTVATLQQEIEHLTNQLCKATDEAGSVLGDHEKLQEDNKKLKQKLADTHTELEARRVQLDEMKQQLATLRKKADTSTTTTSTPSKEIQATIAGLNSKIETLQQELHDARERNKVLGTENVELGGEVETLKHMRTEDKALDDEVRTLSAACENLTKEIETLKSSNAILEKKNKSLLNATDSEERRLRFEVEQQRVDNANIQHIFEASELSSAARRKECEELRLELLAKTNEVKELTVIAAQATTSYAAMKDEASSGKKEARVLGARLGDEHERVEILQKTMEAAQAENKELHGRISVLEHKVKTECKEVRMEDLISRAEELAAISCRESSAALKTETKRRRHLEEALATQEKQHAAAFAFATSKFLSALRPNPEASSLSPLRRSSVSCVSYAPTSAPIPAGLPLG